VKRTNIHELLTQADVIRGGGIRTTANAGGPSLTHAAALLQRPGRVNTQAWERGRACGSRPGRVAVRGSPPARDACMRGRAREERGRGPLSHLVERGHWPPVSRWTGRRFFLFLFRFSDPGSDSPRVQAPRARFSGGFLLHRLRHLPLHTTVLWGDSLGAGKRGWSSTLRSLPL
jgi:hypothetical protein